MQWLKTWWVLSGSPASFVLTIPFSPEVMHSFIENINVETMSECAHNNRLLGFVAVTANIGNYMLNITFVAVCSEIQCIFCFLVSSWAKWAVLYNIKNVILRTEWKTIDYNEFAKLVSKDWHKEQLSIKTCTRHTLSINHEYDILCYLPFLKRAKIELRLASWTS